MRRNNLASVLLAVLLSVTGVSARAQGLENSVWTHGVRIDSVLLARAKGTDPAIGKKCHELLKKCMKDNDGIQGQIVVMDARTSRILALDAMERRGRRLVEAPVRQHIAGTMVYLPFVAAECLATSDTPMEQVIDIDGGVLQAPEGFTIRDHNWHRGGYGRMTFREAILHKSRVGMYHAIKTVPDGMEIWNCFGGPNGLDPATNVVEMAATFNSVYHLDSLTTPAIGSGDAVCTPMNITDRQRQYIREIATGPFGKDGFYRRFIPASGVTQAGTYSTVPGRTGRTASYVSCFPADHPRYVIGIVVEMKDRLWPRPIYPTVTTLIDWLEGRQAPADAMNPDV